MKNLNKKIQQQFKAMLDTDKLFVSSIDTSTLWEFYLSSFEYDPVFRDPESSTHNCNTCNNFIRRYGNIVALDSNNKIMTLFDVDGGETYGNSMKVLSRLLKSYSIKDVFFEEYKFLNERTNYEKTTKRQEFYKLGIETNSKIYTEEEADKFGVVTAGEIYTFTHFNLSLPRKYVIFDSTSKESKLAEYRSNKDVFLRTVKEIKPEILEIVLDLIDQNSILNGETYKPTLQVIHGILKEIDSTDPNLDNIIWNTIYFMPGHIARFKNTLIGVLCTEISKGVPLEKACLNWNKRVDPVNYMRASAPITQRQIKDAEKFVLENGYEESFNRRFATIDDINVREIQHIDVSTEMKKFSLFDNVEATKNIKLPDINNIPHISIDKFLSDILPKITELELYFGSTNKNNLVSLTKAVNDDSKLAFKWDNNYSWTYFGNIAGKSFIKDAVKRRGGSVEGDLNIRLAFPTVTNDYDLHVIEPNDHRIYYGNVRQLSPSGGMLDLDAQGVDGYQEPKDRVENVIYKDKDTMLAGIYSVHVDDYSRSKFPGTFTVEVEIEDQIHVFELKQTSVSSRALVCDIKYTVDGKFTIIPGDDVVVVESPEISEKIWGIQTNKFHKVNLVCKSPNYWGDNKVGHKHYLFMLEDCKPDSNLRSFHNENLNSELSKHRKVMEIVSATNMLKPTDDALSGLGFNATAKEEAIIKVDKGRMYLIKF